MSAAPRASGARNGRVVGVRALAPVQWALHVLDAAYDAVQYLRFFTPARSRTRGRRKLEALLFLHYHAIEKGLALARTPAPFGASQVTAVLDHMDRWLAATGEVDAVAYRGARDALAAYHDRLGESLARAHPALARRLEDRLGASATGAPPIGGTVHLSAADLQGAASAGFEQLAALRHSVRDFAALPVADDVITRAVRVAQRTPSACNRQPWRVHVFTSPAERARVLRAQNGNAGFGERAARVLLVTADTRVFVTSSERHQGLVDGGMFAMSLVYALLAQGVVSCCLNLSGYAFQDVAVHRACRVPPWEQLVMMIALGYPPPEVEVAASARLPLESMLVWSDR